MFLLVALSSQLNKKIHTNSLQWVDNPAKENRFKRNVSKKLLEVKTIMETTMKANYSRVDLYVKTLDKEFNKNFNISSWWKDPKVYILSEDEFNSLS